MTIKPNHPWRWIPGLYFGQGLFYAVVTLLSTIIYKTLGLSNSKVAFYTSLLYLPWVLKPLWSPWLEAHSTKRSWVIVCQWINVALFLSILICLHTQILWLSLGCFFALAMSSASYDLVSDGIYLEALSPGQLTYFVGVRTFFYQVGRLFAVGGLTFLAGKLSYTEGIVLSWEWIFLFIVLLAMLLAIYHSLVLPTVKIQTNAPTINQLASIKNIWREFLQIPRFWSFILFLFVYNIAETQVIKIMPLFYLDLPSQGGLGLSITNVGMAEGIIGVFSMILGVYISTLIISKHGIMRSLMPMTILMTLGSATYFLLFFPEHSLLLWTCIITGIFNFTFGMANAAYMSYLLQRISAYQYSMSFYAMSTAIMTLGMLIPAALSGILIHWLHYSLFFGYIVLLNIIITVYTYYIKQQELTHGIIHH